MAKFGIMSSLSQCVFTSIKRLSLVNHVSQRCFNSATSPLLFRMTQVVWAEPLKKKKKMDPQVVRQREERKKKKIEKSIRRLEKNSSQLKPLDETEVPLSLSQEKEMRMRINSPISEEEELYRANLFKKWCCYKQQQHMAEVYMIDGLQGSINKALEELRMESEELWLEAIQIDPTFLPFRVKGPVGTPPIKGFDAVDGEYINETKKWE